MLQNADLVAKLNESLILPGSVLYVANSSTNGLIGGTRTIRDEDRVPTARLFVKEKQTVGKLIAELLGTNEVPRVHSWLDREFFNTVDSYVAIIHGNHFFAHSDHFTAEYGTIVGPYYAAFENWATKEEEHNLTPFVALRKLLAW